MTGISNLNLNNYGGYASYSPSTSIAAASQNVDKASINTSGASESTSEASERAAKRAGIEECETCKNRKYQDGSDENVSFKSASHISPNAAASAVRSHEQEHVANAYDKAKQDGGEVISASVSIQTSVCPECGRTYVSGGETTTQIKYTNESNPYQQARKQEDAGKYTGMNVNLTA